MPSWLSDFLKFKKGLSPERAVAIAERLNLNKVEKELFLLSVSAHHARSPSSRAQASAELARSLARKNVIRQLSLEEQKHVNDWYSYAILELAELKTCAHTAAWFAQKLQLPQALVERAIDELIQVGLLEFKNKKYYPSCPESESTFDVPSASIRAYHAQVLERAGRALDRQSVTEREFLNATMAFASQDLPAVKVFIRDFQKRFIDRFCNDDANRDSVYQLSLLFFRLDEK